MGGVDVAINATILACILVILLIFMVLWARGELENYQDVPEPEEPSEAELLLWAQQPTVREVGPSEYQEGKFIIRAPRAGDLVAGSRSTVVGIVTEAGEIVQEEESA